MPVGWYPDPITGTGERYWDGIDWSTEFTRDDPQEIERHAPIEYDYELECADFARPSNHSRGGIVAGCVLLVLGVLVVTLKAWSLMGTILSLEQIRHGYGPEVAGVFLLLLAIVHVYKWGAGRLDDSVGAPDAGIRLSTSALILIAASAAIIFAFMR